MKNRLFVAILAFLTFCISASFAGEKEDADAFMKALLDAQKNAQNGKAVDMDAVYKSTDKLADTENIVKRCYFDTFEKGKFAELKNYDGDIQISSQCVTAMLKYNEYRKAISTKVKQSVIEELWNQHVVCAKLAIQLYQQLSPSR